MQNQLTTYLQAGYPGLAVISSEEARAEALRWLEAASLVLRQQDGWDRRDGARLSFTNCSVPILEV